MEQAQQLECEIFISSRQRGVVEGSSTGDPHLLYVCFSASNFFMQGMKWNDANFLVESYDKNIRDSLDDLGQDGMI